MTEPLSEDEAAAIALRIRELEAQLEARPVCQTPAGEWAELQQELLTLERRLDDNVRGE